MGYSLLPLGNGVYKVMGVRVSPTTGKYITHKEEHMSNETVQVPVALLKRWEDEFGHRIPVDFLQEVVALIPAPPKVGETITGEQFAALPPRTVAIDPDGDVWVRGDSGEAILVQAESNYGTIDYTVHDYYMATDLGQGTLVHIGTEAI